MESNIVAFLNFLVFLRRPVQYDSLTVYYSPWVFCALPAFVVETKGRSATVYMPKHAYECLPQLLRRSARGATQPARGSRDVAAMIPLVYGKYTNGYESGLKPYQGQNSRKLRWLPLPPLSLI